MLEKLLQNDIFVKMMQMHASDIIEHLFKEEIHFSILTNVSRVGFEPTLPEDITKHFKPMTVFSLGGYTYESASLDPKTLVFEAGFGRQNVGSIVSVPLDAILQIIVDETPIYINMSLPKEPHVVEEKKVQRSMDAFLSNPENKKLFD